jgi:hypothetical protein
MYFFLKVTKPERKDSCKADRTLSPLEDKTLNKGSDLAVIDITIMPKAITYPSDAPLAGLCHRQLVAEARNEGAKFRQTFCKRLPGLIWQVCRYAHTRQFKRMHKVLRQMHRKLAQICEAIVELRTREQWSERLNHKLHALQVLNQHDDRSVKEGFMLDCQGPSRRPTMAIPSTRRSNVCFCTATKFQNIC